MVTQKSLQVRALNAAIGFLDRYPRAVRAVLRPLANAPGLSRWLHVLPRAYLGATAFEIHDVDHARGRIGIGGVEEIMAGAKIVHLLHTALGERLGEDEKNAALYEMGRKLCRWEVSEALRHGRWAPAALVPLIFGGRILDEIALDPHMARFFQKTLETMSRLITDEGGWGHLDFDFGAEPYRVLLSHSQEARWLGPSAQPVCNKFTSSSRDRSMLPRSLAYVVS